MRRYNINSGWKFTKEDGSFASQVSLPHTWDIRAGQNGSGGYVGPCVYEKEIELSDEWAGRDIYLEIGAANSVAEVIVNGRRAGIHKGGYSLFRVKITELVKQGERNLLRIRVDNSVREDVYPIAADYTFFGGIYRDVNLVVADRTRFCLDDDGSDGIYVRADLSGRKGRVRVQSVVDDPEGCELCYQIFDQEGRLCAKAQVPAETETAELLVDMPDLWDGPGQGRLYFLLADLLKDGRWMEKREVKFGFRSISLSAKTGFCLNGKRMRLHGVGRHQDREDRGFSVTREDMAEDMAFIKEIGANSVRLAHYQHAPCFYELCDREGVVVWAEIPFISRLSDSMEARQNAMQQLRELIKQNYNHPSICFWGIGNDVTMFGEENWLVGAMQEMNDLAKRLDPDRLTVCSQMMTLREDSPLNRITDGVGYNIYYGWYVGECSDLDEWLVKLEQNLGDIPVAISEYGADGILSYQTRFPMKGDYSESYQSLYHEQMMAIIQKHDFLWASYVWNLFDFSAVNRREGGVSGRNHKGLITYDRKTKKDAFYLYQAEWSDRPVVHIVGRRYKKRAESRTAIRVYSNADQVELFVNGRLEGTMCRDGRIFWLDDVALSPGRNDILVKTERGDHDDIILYGESADEPSYVFRQEENTVRDETEYSMKNGFFSVYDSINELLEDPEAKAILETHVGRALMNHPMLKLLGDYPLESVARKSGGLIKEEWIIRINECLIRVRKTRE